MGTHSSISLTTESGEHFCIERTMDGQLLAEHGPSIIRALIGWKDDQRALMLGLINHASKIGKGEVETHDDREHAQEYGVLIDFQKKLLSTYNVPVIRTNSIMFLYEDSGFIGHLLAEGWTVDQNGKDCMQEQI